MYRVVIFLERLLELLGPDSVEFAEPFTNEAVELRVRSFLRTTLDDHVAHFDLGISISRRGSGAG